LEYQKEYLKYKTK